MLVLLTPISLITQKYFPEQATPIIASCAGIIAGVSVVLFPSPEHLQRIKQLDEKAKEAAEQKNNN